jgi:HlyD family secretion protein
MIPMTKTTQDKKRGGISSLFFYLGSFVLSAPFLETSCVAEAGKTENHSPRKQIGASGYIEPSSRIIHISHDMGHDSAVVKYLAITEGQFVNKGDLLVTFTDHPRKEALYQISLAKVGSLQARIKGQTHERNYWKKEFARQQKLNAANAGVESKKDEIERNYQKAEASLEELQSELNSAKMEKALALEHVHQAQIKAPISGVILKIHAREGEGAHAKGIATIADLTKMEVVAEVHEHDISHIQLGQKANITIPGLGQTFEGKVVYKGHQVHKNSLIDPNPQEPQDLRVMEVRIAIPATDNSKINHLIHSQVFVRF